MYSCSLTYQLSTRCCIYSLFNTQFAEIAVVTNTISHTVHRLDLSRARLVRDVSTQIQPTETNYWCAARLEQPPSYTGTAGGERR